MAEAVSKERAREHEAGREAEIAGDKNTAGLGIELAAMQRHKKLLQKIQFLKRYQSMKAIFAAPIA